MSFRNSILSALCTALCVFCTAASAQTVEQLFNPAAREYIYGNTSVASNLVEQALLKFPESEKLQKLKELIDQQNEKKQKNQPQNRNQPPDNPSDSSEKQNPQNPPPDPNKKPPEQQQNQQPPAGGMSPAEAQQLLDAMKQNERAQRADLRPYLGPPVPVEKDW
jgi:outer membrane biosynthesis protein TonB